MNEGKKDRRDPIRAVKPRNFVAKNAVATTSGAGAHKDKKKAMKQGDVKHKKQEYAEGLQNMLETALRDKEDYHEKRKALDTLSRNKDVDQKAVQQRRLDLDKEAKKKGIAEGVPQPGPSSGAPKQFGADAKIQTRQMTVKDIISSVPGVPYYNNVVDDWDAKDYSWGVTKKVIEYATYLKDHPESLAKLPPAIVLNDKFEDGAHRVSAIWLLQQRMDPKNPLWKNAKLNVQFVKQGVAEDFDNPEYDDEAGMSHGSLHTIQRAAEGLLDVIQQGDDLPEWCQEKISLAEDYLVTVWDYLQSEKAQGVDPEIGESGLQYYTGKKKYGKNGMTALAAAGRKGASQEELGRIKDKYIKKEGWTHDTLAAQLFETENTYEEKLNNALNRKLGK